MTKLKSFDSSDKRLHIGDIFTPLFWGEFAIDTFGIYDKWINGATVFDPTMGEGNLLEALITFGLSKGKLVSELPTRNLFGNELNSRHYNAALSKFEANYGLDMRLNFFNSDLLQLKKRNFDILLGNPPWQNFVDLPASYKQQIKPYFFEYGLVENSQLLLLGGSRIDFAALITNVAIKDFLTENGEAIFFLPLSLFLNDGANKAFRSYSIGDVSYCLKSIHDFVDQELFPGVSTRYGLAHFVKNSVTHFPIPYYQLVEKNWQKKVAKPLFHNSDPLSVFGKNETSDLKIPVIKLFKESTPRQGINTCGANDLFFFDQCTGDDADHLLLSNKRQKNVRLPKKYIYPLLTSKDFTSANKPVSKWVFVPYNPNGKPISWEQIEHFPALESYLNEHKTQLETRKGVMLQSLLKRGYWWALLGVGEYNFFPFKIVWEAYGKTTFTPKIFSGNCQANQSLQAFIPIRTKEKAKEILTQLSSGEIQQYLSSLNMEGTMNWAQPGKIKKFISFED